MSKEYWITPPEIYEALDLADLCKDSQDWKLLLEVVRLLKKKGVV